MSENHTGQPPGADPTSPAPQSYPDGKIVQLTDQIMADGPAAVNEMERRRQIMFRAFDLTAGQLEHDAGELTTRAVMVPELDMVKREHMVHTAFMLRETAAWIRTMLLPPKAEEPKPA